MKNKPPLDRELLIPIIIGVISILGIGLIFSLADLDRGQAPVPLGPAETPFKYLLLATQTSTSKPELEATASEEILQTAVTMSTFVPRTTKESIPSPVGTPSSIETVINDDAFAATVIPPVSEALPIDLGKFDDTNPNVEYGGDWSMQTNLGTAFQGTLHVSNTVGNYVTLSFEGEQMQLGYQSAAGFGSLIITIDEGEYVLDQIANGTWVSPQLTSDTHYVIIFHESGDTINLDYIVILDVN
ncbi:MAG: hypothetical protein EHM33_07150 [Chloroflexi bacterium]|nr:MAG: hypothetical protein EHM33_07150 [Chloroflexota bacterium]